MIRTISSFGVSFKETIDKMHATKLLTNGKKLISSKSDLTMNGLQRVVARNSKEHFEYARLACQQETIGERLESISRSFSDDENCLNLFSNLSNDAQLEVSNGGPVDGSYARWCGMALVPRMRMAELTRTRRAFAAAEL